VASLREAEREELVAPANPQAPEDVTEAASRSAADDASVAAWK
jgi:hypothetical protein